MQEKDTKGLKPRERVSDDVRFEGVTQRFPDGSAGVDSPAHRNARLGGSSSSSAPRAWQDNVIMWRSLSCDEH